MVDTENIKASRYARQEIFRGIGKDGQKKLKSGRVAIVELSAIGTAVANNLARAGVGYIRLIDGDYIDVSELQRQSLYTEEDAREERMKAAVLKEYLQQVNSEIEIDAQIAVLDSGNIDSLFEDVDLIIDATDSFETRLLINEACVALGKPWIYGGALAASGMTMNFLPGEDQPCFKCFIGDEEYVPGEQPTCATEGVLHSTTSMIASLQSAEALKYLTGSADLRKDLLSFDVWDNSFDTFTVDKDPDCPVCGRHEYRYYGKVSGAHMVSMCGKDSMQIIPRTEGEIDFARYAEKLQTQGKVSYTQYTLDFDDGDCQIKLFKNGRAIIKHVNDEQRARAVYAEYIGL